MKKLITLAAIAMVMVATLQTVFSQPVDPTYWHYKQKKSNWLFEHDTVRINCLRIDNKLAIDSSGRLWWYNNSAATLGNILVGNGTYYNQLGIGSTGQVLTVSGGTASWQSITGGTVSGLTADQPLYGASDGSIGQDDLWYYDPATQYMRLGDPSGLALDPSGSYNVTDGNNSAALTPNGIGLSTTIGTLNMFGDRLEFMDTGGDLFSIGRATYSTDERILFPSAKGTAGQSFYVVSVVGDDVTLGWQTALTSEVDGSTSNELQNLSYDAANHEVDISLGGTSATIPLAVDDGATEGLASFDAADFTATAGNIVIDYANGQAATSGQDGFLQSSDWTTFNNKVGLVQAPTELSGQTSSIGASTVYTTPASDGYYRVTVTATVTTAAGSTMDLGIQLRYTEATDNVVKTFPNGNVNGYNRTTTNTTAATVSVSAVCHVKASTNIQYITSWSPSGGSPAYNVHVTVEKLY